MMNCAIERRGIWTEDDGKTRPELLLDLAKRLKDEMVHTEKDLFTA